RRRTPGAADRRLDLARLDPAADRRAGALHARPRVAARGPEPLRPRHRAPRRRLPHRVDVRDADLLPRAHGPRRGVWLAAGLEPDELADHLLPGRARVRRLAGPRPPPAL